MVCFGKWMCDGWELKSLTTPSVLLLASPIMMEFKQSCDVLLSFNLNSSGGYKSRSKCGVGRVGSSWGPWGRICSTLSPSFWGLGGNLWPLLACRSITPISACILTCRSPLCASNHSCFQKIPNDRENFSEHSIKFKNRHTKQVYDPNFIKITMYAFLKD